MYNRYIPQSDGSYQRNRVQDHRHCAPQKQERPINNPPTPPPVCPPPEDSGSCNNSTFGFLKQLLPKEFDAGDLMIILLLLLMAGDCEEEKNNALLTLALYFFL